ncbi:MAG: autotransporter-associated beta strand repeat-containing protein, partial [Kiritimatiellia bacterium]
GAKNGATQIELNPVNGDLTLNGAIFNDNSVPYAVYGNNGKTLTINTTLGVGATPGNVFLNIEQNSTVVVNNAQNHAGGTNIRAGVLQISDTSALGAFSGVTGYLGLANAGTLRYTGTGSQSDGRDLWIDTGTQTKTIEVTSATGSLNFTGTGGQITQPLAKTGAGALILADVVTSRHLTVSGGTLTTGAITMAQSGGQTLTVAGGAGLTSPSFAASWPVTVTVNGAGTFSTGNISLSTGATSSISGAGSVTATGVSIFNFMALNFGASGTTLNNSGSFSFSGTATLNVSGGTLNTGRLVTADNSGAVSTFNQSAGTVNVTGSNATNTTSASFLLSHWNAASTYNLSGGVLNAPNAPLALGWDGTPRLIQTGGTANLQGINFADGRNNAATYQLTSGRLNIGSYGMSGNASAKWLELNGGTLGATANWTGAQQILVAAASTVDTLDAVDGLTGRTITINGVISGAGQLNKAGAGTLVLGGGNTHTGALVVNGGTLSLSGAAARGSSSFTANAGATLELNGTNIFVAGHGIALASTRTLAVNGATLLMTGNMDARFGNVVLNNGSTWTSNRGYVNGYDALLANTDLGPATVTVSGTGAATMNGSGGIRLQGVQNFDVADVTSSPATDLAVSMTLGPEGTIGAPAGGINKTGPGTMTLTGANTYTGATTVNGGILQIGNGGAAGTLGSGPVTVNAALAFNRSDAVNIANAIGGTGTLTQSGAGTTTLAAGNTYAGTTYVSQGALIIDGSTDSAGRIDVSAGATLGGGGSGGTASVADDGIFAPGGADNEITLTGLSLSGNAISKFDLDDPVSPFWNDTAVIGAGALVLDGRLQVGPQAGAPGYDFSTAPAGTKWLLMTYAGSITDNGVTAESAPALAPGLAYAVDSTSTPGSVFSPSFRRPGAGR